MVNVNILSGLSNFARKRAGGFLRRAINQAVQPENAYDLISEAMPGYDKHTFKTDYGIVNSAQNKWSKMKYVNRDKKISNRLYQRAVKKLDTNYQTTVRIRGISTKTGERVERHITLGHDKVMERGKLEQEAINQLETAGSPIVVEQSRPVGGLETR